MKIENGMRAFETGATRNIDTTKLDFEGFYSPEIMEAFGTYMNFNRDLPDGGRRDGDNWQKGIPLDAYMKSAWRHFFDWWKFHRGHETKEGIVWALTGLLFNVQGYLHELLKKDPTLLAKALAHNTALRNAARRVASVPIEDVIPIDTFGDAEKASWRVGFDNAVKTVYTKQNMQEE